MEFKKEKIVSGVVVQRDFDIKVAGETVPCVVWAAQGARSPRPLIIMGHGGSQHKKTLIIRGAAIEYARNLGYATLAIDAPGHGDRISREEAARLAEQVGARVLGKTTAPRPDPARWKMMTERSMQVVREWKAALDAVQELDFVGRGGPVGYWGVSLGTMYGVPFVAEEPRVKCAVFGLAGLRPGAVVFEAAARRITVPLQFLFQWDDAVAPRENGIALFEAFGSKQKTMHINPGGHIRIPPFERDAWESFYMRHLS